MLKKIMAAAVAAFALSGAASAAEPLVDSAWVAANAGKPGVVFLDTRAKTDYLRGHVPGAVHTDYAKDGWRVERADKVPDMLPSDLNTLAKLIGGLGIGNADHVVVMPPGANSTDVGIATRIYWTFKVLGHDNVSVLNGGVAAYDRDKANPQAQGAVAPAAKSFAIAPRMAMVATLEDVKKAMAAGIPLIDARTEDQFVGINRHPKAKISGTIPGALNLPQSWLTENGGGAFRGKAQLESLLKLSKVPASGDQIMFCNTGHWASIGWFVASELLGNKQVRLYDGSMVEWTVQEGIPMETRVKF